MTFWAGKSSFGTSKIYNVSSLLFLSPLLLSFLVFLKGDPGISFGHFSCCNMGEGNARASHLSLLGCSPLTLGKKFVGLALDLSTNTLSFLSLGASSAPLITPGCSLCYPFHHSKQILGRRKIFWNGQFLAKYYGLHSWGDLGFAQISGFSRYLTPAGKTTLLITPPKTINAFLTQIGYNKHGE